MQRIEISFLVLATLSLVVGSGLGLWIGTSHDLQPSSTYTSLIFVGWTSLALFGLCYRVYPNLASSWIAMPQVILASFSTVLLPVGIALSITNVTPSVAFAGALLWLASNVLFLVNVLRVALTESRTSSRPSRRVLTQSPANAGGSAGFDRWRESLES